MDHQFAFFITRSIGSIGGMSYTLKMQKRSRTIRMIVALIIVSGYN